MKAGLTLTPQTVSLPVECVSEPGENDMPGLRSSFSKHQDKRRGKEEVNRSIVSIAVMPEVMS